MIQTIAIRDNVVGFLCNNPEISPVERLFINFCVFSIPQESIAEQDFIKGSIV